MRKTTTLKTINRLIEPDAGKVFVGGKDISAENPVKLRRSIGYVIQQIGLFPNMTVEQNIAVVPKLLNYPREKWKPIVQDLLALVDMPYERFAHKYPSELSGGQQQRIGVLRALAASPPIVLMDEPFGALDPITRDSLQEEIRRIQKKLKKTIVFVTQDMEEALRLADVDCVYESGEDPSDGPARANAPKSRHPSIKSFMGRHMENGSNGASLLAEDFMRTKVVKVPKTSRTMECIDLMSRRDVNTLMCAP
jgi:osmoprotectant transport system ATP-binding protein